MGEWFIVWGPVWVLAAANFGVVGWIVKMLAS